MQYSANVIKNKKALYELIWNNFKAILLSKWSTVQKSTHSMLPLSKKKGRNKKPFISQFIFARGNTGRINQKPMKLFAYKGVNDPWGKRGGRDGGVTFLNTTFCIILNLEEC